MSQSENDPGQHGRQPPNQPPQPPPYQNQPENGPGQYGPPQPPPLYQNQPRNGPGQYGSPQPYPSQPYPYQLAPYQQPAQGQKYKDTSFILGIVGLFVIGVILGPLAIIKANQAEALGVKATAGKVLGWIDTIMGGIGVLFFLISLGA